METIPLLRQLSETPGPSGQETPIAQHITELWRPLADEVTRAPLGSVAALKRGQGPEPRPRLMLAAHMDEIGLLTSDIVAAHGYGFLRVINLGGIDIRQTLAQPVLVHGRRDLPGVLGCRPISLLPAEKQSKAIDLEDLVVDVGLPIETVRELVQIGDFITFDQPLQELRGGLVAGKALDNRASVAALTLMLHYLQGRQHTWDVLAVATIQEETRLLGAYTASHHYRPDLAIALDVCFGKGPGANDGTTIPLGSGPVLDIGVNVHPGVAAALEQTADALEMKVARLAHAHSSGTDAIALQIAHSGVPTGLVSIPLRYMHTLVETVAVRDVERTGRLLAEFAAHLEASFVAQLTQRLMEA